MTENDFFLHLLQQLSLFLFFSPLSLFLQGDQGDDGEIGLPGKSGARGKIGVLGLPGDQGSFGPKVRKYSR